MAYQQNGISALAQIPALMYSFAPTAGLTVGGSSAAPTLAIDGIHFLLSATTDGFDQELRWDAQSAPSITSAARTRSPKLNGTTATPTVSAPTKVHFIAGLSPAPYLAIIVEYGFNSYRHLYLGGMDKIGGYIGGQVISGCDFAASADGADYPRNYRDPAHQYLFSGFQALRTPSEAGGVLVDHANNGVKWRTFACPITGNPVDTMTGSEAFGGFSDEINDAYVARGIGTFAGINMLVPIQLYAPTAGGATANFAPLGNPAGVRMVNLSGIDPGAQLTIGSDTWYLFPAFSKKEATTVGKSLGGWAAEETSHVIGYAYLG